MAAGLGEISRGRALTIGAPIPSFTQRFSPPHRVSESAFGVQILALLFPSCVLRLVTSFSEPWFPWAKEDKSGIGPSTLPWLSAGPEGKSSLPRACLAEHTYHMISVH